MSCDGKATTEVSRRLREAANTFKQLDQLWSRSSLGWKRKYKIYDSVVLSKLLYSLDSLWLLKADRARLDAFHCKSLRRILGIPSAYISRVSNASVLQKASAKPLSQMLLSSQKKLYNNMATYDSSSFVKRLLFNENGTLRDWSARRKRGRPRQQWASSVQSFA